MKNNLTSVLSKSPFGGFRGLLLFLFWGLGGFLGSFGLFAQSVVRVTDPTVTAGASPTITFQVGWASASTSSFHRDTVWLFADYQIINTDGTTGAWTAASITGVTATPDASRVIATSLNGRGFYIDGHGVEPFASTVTITLAAPVDKRFNACVYASDYPPNATLQSGGGYVLKGTPPFIINDTIYETTHTFGAGTCIESIRDSTGCEGLVINSPLVTGEILSTGETICVGGTPSTITGITAHGGDEQLSYSWYVNDTPISGAMDANYTPPATLTAGIYTYTRKANDQTCNITPALSTGSWVLTVEAAPTVTLAASSAAVCTGSTVTLTATPAGADSYNFNGSGWQPGNTTAATVTSDTAFTVKALSALGCESAEDSVTVYASLNDITELIVASPPHCTNIYACTLTFAGWTATPGWEIEYGHGNTAGSNILGATTAGSITLMGPTDSGISGGSDSNRYFWARTKNSTCHTTGTARMDDYHACLCAPSSYNCCQTCGQIALWSYYYGLLGGVCGCTQTNGSMNNITGCIVVAYNNEWNYCHHTDYGPYYWEKHGSNCH